jgi:hypothetical protein
MRDPAILGLPPHTPGVIINVLFFELRGHI